MGIEIKIIAECVADAQKEMEQLLHGRHEAPISPVVAEAPAPVATPLPVEQTAPEAPAAEEAPKRRGRPKKETAAPAPAPEEAPAQAISTSPEDRRDPAEEADEPEVDDADVVDEDETGDEDDDLIGGFAITGEGLQAAMMAHAAKFGFEETTKHGLALFGGGFSKRSDVVAAGEPAIRAALGRFVKAIQSGKAGG